MLAVPGRRRSLIAVAAIAYLLASTVPLIWILWQGGGWVAGDAAVFRTTIDGELYEAVGLTYRGAGASLMLWGELVGVVTALAVSLFGPPRARLVAHILLVVWAGLLFVNAWWFVLASGLQMLRGAILLVTLGTLAVVVRTLAAWPRTGASEVAAGGSAA